MNDENLVEDARHWPAVESFEIDPVEDDGAQAVQVFAATLRESGLAAEVIPVEDASDFPFDLVEDEETPPISPALVLDDSIGLAIDRMRETSLKMDLAAGLDTSKMTTAEAAAAREKEIARLRKVVEDEDA